ncbi:amphi-Trp domain-containing protein [Haloarcula laminariae]|uniref:amphi-Trp domain-containing protein n=1 Tax=Haloarcula laminariae TaxID=2961577 RepID=UPI0021CA8239|nr:MULTISPECIES: amphi-Trp domain-containing protein [Halomicroarcula]
MADTTTHETELTRAETAEFLRSIADELDAGRDRIRVAVGNKRVQLSPPERIAAEATVTERSRRLRKDVEELDLHFRWTPTKATAEAAADGGARGDTGPE